MINVNQLSNEMGEIKQTRSEVMDQEYNEMVEATNWIRQATYARKNGLPVDPPSFRLQQCAIKMGMTVSQYMDFWMTREKSEAALQRKIARDADREYETRMAAQANIDRQNALLKRDQEIKSMAKLLTDQRDENARIEAEIHADYENRLSAARDAEIAVYHALVDRQDGKPLTTWESIIARLRDLRDLAVDGVSPERLTSSLNEIIAGISIMNLPPTEYISSTQIVSYPHWSSDGWRLFWKRRRSRGGDEENQRLETVDINTITPTGISTDKNFPDGGFTYYLYGEAMAGKKRRTIYIGTRAHIDTMLIETGKITAEGSVKSEMFLDYSHQTRYWRAAQATRRGQRLSL
jgi:hypothetical protein